MDCLLGNKSGMIKWIICTNIFLIARLSSRVLWFGRIRWVTLTPIPLLILATSKNSIGFLWPFAGTYPLTSLRRPALEGTVETMSATVWPPTPPSCWDPWNSCWPERKPSPSRQRRIHWVELDLTRVTTTQHYTVTKQGQLYYSGPGTLEKGLIFLISWVHSSSLNNF